MPLTIPKKDTEPKNSTELRLKSKLGGSFISPTEVCEVFNKPSLESATCHLSDALESFVCRMIKKGVKVEGDEKLLVYFPSVTGNEIRFLLPDLVMSRLSPRESNMIMKEKTKAGLYLIDRGPKHTSYNGMCMREMGVIQGNPPVVHVLLLLALSNALKKRVLIDKFYTLCREEVSRKGIRFQINIQVSGTNRVEIAPSNSQFCALSSLLINKVA